MVFLLAFSADVHALDVLPNTWSPNFLISGFTITGVNFALCNFPSPPTLTVRNMGTLATVSTNAINYAGGELTGDLPATTIPTDNAEYDFRSQCGTTAASVVDLPWSGSAPSPRATIFTRTGLISAGDTGVVHPVGIPSGYPTLTINGANFFDDPGYSPGDDLEVAFSAGGLPTCTTQTILSSSQILCDPPAMSAGVYTIRVTRLLGLSHIVDHRYEVLSVPTVTNVAPRFGPTGETHDIVISGTNFGTDQAPDPTFDHNTVDSITVDGQVHSESK